MAIVPRASNVRQSALPGARVNTSSSLESFGGGASLDRAGQAAQQAMGTAKSIFDEEKKKADQIAFMEADRKASELQTKLQVEMSQMKGRDSANAPTYVQEQWEKGVQEITSGLSNSVQKDSFNRSHTNRWEGLNKNVQFHMRDQLNQYDEQNTAAYIATARDAAKLNAHDDEQIGLELDRQRAAVTEWAERNGVMNSDIYKARLTDEVSQTHREVINSRLNAGQAPLAKEYFEKAKERGELTAADTSRIEGALKEGILRGQSQAAATQIMATYGDDTKSALEEARKISDPEVQDATVKEVKLRMAENENIKREVDEARFKDAANVAETTKERPAPGQWAQLSLQERNAIDNRIDQLRRGIQPETNWDDYYELKTMASSQDLKQKFLEMNLAIYRPKMADTEYKEMINLQTALRKKDQSAENILDGYRTDGMIVNDSLADAGIDPTPKKGSTDASRVNQFRRKVDEELRVLQERTGKKATNEEVQGIVDNLMVKGTVPNSGVFGFFKTKKRAFEVAPGEQVELDPADIPVKERQAIEAALQRNGKPVTEQNILKLYSAGMVSGPRGN